MSPEFLLAFLAMTTVSSFIPGPSVLFVAGQGAWRGRRAGLLAVMGVQLGVFTYFVLTAIGLTQLIAASNLVFTIIKWLGAAYLVWLGLTAIIASFNKSVDDQPAAPMRASMHGFRDGLFVSLSNPKGLLYFLAILPQFIDPTRAMIPQVAQLGVIAMAIDTIAQSTYALAGSALSVQLSQPGIRRWFERGIGSLFIGLAAVTALFRRAI